MGTYAARKALTVVEHVENGMPLKYIISFLYYYAVLAIELLAACQALDCHRKVQNEKEKPIELSLSDTLTKVYELVRRHVKYVINTMILETLVINVEY